MAVENRRRWFCQRLLAGTIVAVLGIGGVACGTSDSGDETLAAGSSAPAAVVRVFAAASLTDAFRELELEFEAENPQYDVELNLAGSSSLQAQILAGAPADLFAAANEAVLEPLLADTSLNAEAPQSFATNRLLIAVPTGNPAGLSGIDDFTRAELFLGLCAIEVPCGSLAEAVFFERGIVPAIDTREPDVRALLTKVAERELDAGLVYETDVLAASERVDSIEVNSGKEITARYPMTVLGSGTNPQGGAAFATFVLSSDGQQILGQYGFGQP